MPWEKRFDEKEALERALEAFWAGGYEATSMTELLDRMGIQKGSFYATFGCKHQVLLSALDIYSSRHLAALGDLCREASPRAALERHLDDVLSGTSGPEGKLGCFLVNASLELSPKDPEVQELAARTLATHEGYYRALLDAARERGEVAADLDSDATARALLALMLGMRVLARSGAEPAMLASIRDQALRLLGPQPPAPA